ncbi:MAG TPA: hypothetical protein VLH94_01080 [Spirochaetia bacterium]|nr:hypothetical protein [Spirochaetia bacterium]
MQKYYFTPDAISGVKITIFDQHGQILHPAPENGRLGCYRHGTKITIALKVEGEHQCYTLDHKTLERVPKKVSPVGEYTKNLTVDCSTGSGQVACWPSNMVCLEMAGQRFNIGLANQDGIFYFVVEEFISTPTEGLPSGTVIGFSLLRGLGVVAYKPLFDARIHWTSLPKDPKTRLRMIKPLTLLELSKEDVVPVNGSSSFRYEIKNVKYYSSVR